MERAAVHAHLETLLNATKLIVDSASQIPCLESELDCIIEEYGNDCDDDEAPQLSIVSSDSAVSREPVSC